MLFFGKKNPQLLAAAGIAFAVLVLGACSGGGGLSGPVPVPQAPSQPQSAQQSIALAAAGVPLTALPGVGGYSESISFPSNNAASGTTLSLTIATFAPSAMPALAPGMHVAQPFLYLTLTTSKTVTLNNYMGFTMKLPAGVHPDNLPVKIGVYNPATGGWAHIGDMTFSGQTATFTPAGIHGVTLTSGVTYYAITYTCGGPSPSPPPSPSPTPTGVVSCTASGTGAIAVLCIGGKTYAFVAKGQGEFPTDTIEEIDISAGAAAASVARHPATYHRYTKTYNSSFAPTECAGDESHLRVFCASFFSGKVTDITASGAGGSSVDFDTGITGILTFSGGMCTICAVAYDPTDNAFIMSEPAGGNSTGFCSGGAEAGQFQSVGENSHAALKTIADPDLNENFGYDYVKNRVFSPHYCAGGFGGTQNFDVADFNNGTDYQSSTTFSSVSLPDSAAVDVSTGVGYTPNESGSTVTTADLDTATYGSPTATQFVVSAMSTSLTTTTLGCGDDNDDMQIDSALHVAFMTGEFCDGGFETMGFATLPSTKTGLTISDWAFVVIPKTPGGGLWDASHDPHPVAAFNSPATIVAANCPDCAIIVNREFTWLGVVDLVKLMGAPRKAGDMHSIDPTYDLIANHVLAFYPI